MLERHGLALDDMDFVEIHEAFAATVATILKAWEDEEFGKNELGLPGAFGTVDPAKLNVYGSSLAAGHPFAATGGRIVASTAKMLYEAGPRKACPHFHLRSWRTGPRSPARIRTLT